jgi:hypothetical protein
LGRRDFEFWVEVGCKLENPGDVADPYAARAQALWRAGKNDAPKWGKRRRGKKGRQEEDDTTQLNMFVS